MIDEKMGLKDEQPSSNFHSFTIPLISNEEKFSKLMKNFSEAFDWIEVNSSSNSLFSNIQYFNDFLEEINNAQNKINKLQTLIENQTVEIASIFLNVQKSLIYEPILTNLLAIKKKNVSFIEIELQKYQNKINAMNIECNISTDKLKRLKDEIKLLKSDAIFSIHEELMKTNDNSIDRAHQLVLYQNEINKNENQISIFNPLVTQKNENLKSIFVNQSLLRSKLATINSQINVISTDCASLSIDIENNTKKINQSKTNINQKKLELSTIENETLSQIEKINQIRNQISEKKDEIRICKESIEIIYKKINEIKSNINKISSFNDDENDDTFINTNITQLQNEIMKLKNCNEQLLSDKESLDKRNKQLENIIEKKSLMIQNDKEKIDKKQSKYNDLQELFKLRKIMLITAFDDINHKYDKLFCKIHQLEKQLKPANISPIYCINSEISYSDEFKSYIQNKSNDKVVKHFHNSPNFAKLNENNMHSIHSFSQTPQTQKFSKLFPASNSQNKEVLHFKNRHNAKKH